MKRPGKTPPIVSIVGKSGSGKTTLLEKLIPALNGLGFRVGTIKHDVHGFEMDKPGKDSWRHKQAGAAVTMISSPFQIGMVKDVDHDHALEELAAYFDTVDIILTEGYKRQSAPKLEVHRSEVSAHPLCGDDDGLMALVSDVRGDLDVPYFDLEDIDAIATFIVQRFELEDK